MTHEEVLDEVNVIYERISNNENNLFSDGKYTEALEVLIDYYETGLIEELEKIKGEIINLGFTGWADKPKLDREEVLMILDKHISELSGDNKEIRCNTCIHNTIFREAKELMFGSECYECVKGIEDWYKPVELKGEQE